MKHNALPSHIPAVQDLGFSGVFDGALMPRDNVQPAIVDGRPVYVASSHGYTVTLMEQQGVGYAIATDMAPQESMHILSNCDLR